MDYRSLHPEDVKAAIRKRFGSLNKFEEQQGLAKQAVTDLLRGKTSARTAAAVNSVLNATPASTLPHGKSGKPDNTQPSGITHRLNAKAA